MSISSESPSNSPRTSSRKGSISTDKIALVTGGNKGIGYEICKKLLENNYIVLMGVRQLDKGEKACSELKKLVSGEGEIVAIEIDISNQESVKAAAANVKQQWQYIDLLINNAGVADQGDEITEEKARWTMATNYYGLLNMQHYFFPLLRTNSRVVNVASSAGISALEKMKPENKDAFLKPTLTIGELTGLIEVFITCCAHGVESVKEMGWAPSMYGVSKAAVVALTRIQARDNDVPGVLVNAAHPGYVKTDMTNPDADLTPEEGANNILAAALFPDRQRMNGMYFSKGRPDRPC